MRQFELDKISWTAKRELSKILSEKNIKIEDVSIKEDEHGFIKINLNASQIENGLTLGERLYLENAEEYGCKPEWLYKRAKLSGKAYEIISWNPNSYRYPLTVKEVYDNKIEKITIKKLISLFSKNYLQDRNFRNPLFR